MPDSVRSASVVAPAVCCAKSADTPPKDIYTYAYPSRAVVFNRPRHGPVLLSPGQHATTRSHGADAARRRRGEARAALDRYLDELRAFPLLSAAAEAEVAQRAAQGDPEARERLLCSNLRYVVAVAKGFRGRGLELEDLVAEGNAGLLTAVERFDPTKGVKFISYAVWWVRQAIQQAIAEQGQVVRLPRDKAWDLARVRKAVVRLSGRLQAAPTTAEVAEEAGVSVKAAGRLLALGSDALRLDAPSLDGQSRELADTLVDPLAPLLEAEAGSALAQAVDTLPARMARIIRLRFGLDGGREHTLEEIGRMLGVSRERVRQVEREGLARLRADRGLAVGPEPATQADAKCGPRQPRTTSCAA